jgi:crossover junction endodeoxyribonuclease RuvC
MGRRASHASGDSIRVLGIDPGLERTGYACIDLEVGTWQPRLIEAGVFRLPRDTSLSHRLRQLELDLAEALAELTPTCLAVETVFSHSKNLRTAILMAHARGVVLVAGERLGLTLVELPPATVKKAISGRGNATKRQVQLAVAAAFGLAEPPEPADVADALAIALAGGHRALAAR